MKNTLFALLAVLVLSACGRSEEALPKAPGPCASLRIAQSWWVDGGTVTFSDYCEVTFRTEDAETFARPSVIGRFDATDEEVTVELDEEVGGLLAGKRDCAYSVKGGGLGTGPTLTITCEDFTWKSGRTPKPTPPSCGIWSCN